jgi:peptide/nickel transport system substrate-binding protein
VAAALSDSLRSTELGSLQDDVDHIGAASVDSVEIDFRRASPLLLDLLGVQLKKPGQAIVGTGPFMAEAQSTTLLKANPRYHLGPPSIDEIRIEQFPSVRTAWAELLRDRIDMLYEVPLDALDSLQSSTNVAVFKFTRPYQLMLVFNTESSAIRPAAVRRGLNMAIDRTQLVRQALNAHGLPSTSPIWPRHWAVQGAPPPSRFDPQQAARALGAAHVRFSCLIAPDQIYERIALELKRQLAIVGVDMEVQAVPVDEMFMAVQKRRYDAILFDGISGPPLLRVYGLWYSSGKLNPGTFGNAAVDAALDRVRHAETEADYREAVVRLEQTFVDDPPAVFLFWSERARAVSKRFVVPVQPDREILGTLRLWKPANAERRASRN